jgi:hypothetical protein
LQEETKLGIHLKTLMTALKDGRLLKKHKVSPERLLALKNEIDELNLMKPQICIAIGAFNMFTSSKPENVKK